MVSMVFLSILLRVLDEVEPDAVAVAFDLRAPTFRHKLYDGYKAQRKECRMSWRRSLSRAQGAARRARLSDCNLRGYEADDILGTLARSSAETGWDCVIATGDRDSLQLVGPHVSVRLATKKMGQPASTLYDEAAVREKYGVEPAQLVDVKALMGDASDNIPGVAGIGEKTALSLIGQYHDIDAIYAQLDTLEIKPGVRKSLGEGQRDGIYEPKAR